METIAEEVFYSKILPLLNIDPKSCVYKRVAPIVKSRKDHIGLYKSEFGKHCFFMVVDPKSKGEVNKKYQDIYYLPPTLETSSFKSDQTTKYLIPASIWQPSVPRKTWISLLEVEMPEVNQLNLNFTKFDPPKEEKVVVAEADLTRNAGHIVNPYVDDVPGQGPKVPEAYDQVNPDHYKSSGIESIEVIEAFFKDNYNLGTTFKYMARSGKKPGVPAKVDISKGIWYLFNELKSHMPKEEIKKFIEEDIIPKHVNA